MTDRMEISIGKKYVEAFDTLKAYAGLTSSSVSSVLGEIIKHHMDILDGKMPIVADESFWDFSKYTNEEIEELNTLICKLNNRLTSELCRR